MDDFKDGNKVIYLPCLHFYHSACITNWIKVKKNCPICKTKLRLNN